MKFEIVMAKEPYKKIQTLMRHIDEINSGDEIGGWLTGKYITNSEKIILYLDKFYIPKQSVTKEGLFPNRHWMKLIKTEAGKYEVRDRNG